MKATYTVWDDDNHHPVDVKQCGGHLDERGNVPPLLTIDCYDDEVRLSFSIPGESWDVDIERDEWPAIRDRINSLFDQGTL